jgi:hypothetical protein
LTPRRRRGGGARGRLRPLHKRLIVALAPLGVAENRIGFIDLPQLLGRCSLLAGGAKEVRVMTFHQLSVGRSNFIGARRAPNTENLIKVHITHESLEILLATPGSRHCCGESVSCNTLFLVAVLLTVA